MLVKTGFMPNPSTPYIQPPKVHKAGPGLGSISVQELLKTLSIEDIVLSVLHLGCRPESCGHIHKREQLKGIHKI